MPDERVYVVARRAVPGGADWYGLRTDGLAAFVAALERDGRYELRERMERDPTFKQVIPYVVLRDEERYFLMQRTSAGGDARLHGRYSIGVGGHLNPGDDGLLGGLQREWHEELGAAFTPTFPLVTPVIVGASGGWFTFFLVIWTLSGLDQADCAPLASIVIAFTG